MDRKPGTASRVLPAIVVVALLLGLPMGFRGAAATGPVGAQGVSRSAPYVVHVRSRAANVRIVRREIRRGTRVLHVYQRAIIGFAALLFPPDVRRLRQERDVRAVERAPRLAPARVGGRAA